MGGCGWDLFWFALLWLEIVTFYGQGNGGSFESKSAVASSNAVKDHPSFSYKIPQERCSSLLA